MSGKVKIYLYGSGGNKLFAEWKSNPASYGAVIVYPNYKQKNVSGFCKCAKHDEVSLQALIEALEELDPGHKIDVYATSRYIKYGMDNYLKTSLVPPSFKDLWRCLRKFTIWHNINCKYIAPNKDNKFLDRAKKLSVEAMAKGRQLFNLSS